MIVVSNSSPLITLARVGQLNLLHHLFGEINVAGVVIEEVVLRGKGKPAAESVSNSSWVKTRLVPHDDELLRLHARSSLGLGELATIALARMIKAELVIMDERAGRRLAQANALSVMGCVGILEIAYRRALAPDLRALYQQLLLQGIRIDRQILDQSLIVCGLNPL